MQWGRLWLKRIRLVVFPPFPHTSVIASLSSEKPPLMIAQIFKPSRALATTEPYSLVASPCHLVPCLTSYSHKYLHILQGRMSMSSTIGLSHGQYIRRIAIFAVEQLYFSLGDLIVFSFVINHVPRHWRYFGDIGGNLLPPRKATRKRLYRTTTCLNISRAMWARPGCDSCE